VQVCEHVLKDRDASEAVLINRAKVGIYRHMLSNIVLTQSYAQGLLIIGAVFKSAVPDESDEERRELERSEPIPRIYFREIPYAHAILLIGWSPKLQPENLSIIRCKQKLGRQRRPS
jgi:hypothetical protein